MERFEQYKDSGVDWIGVIPEHWDVKPVKYLLKSGKEGIKIGPFGSSLKAEHLSLSGYKVYGQENVINNNFDLGWRYISIEKYEELSVYEINPIDVLVTMMGTTGKCQVVPPNIEKGIMDSHLIRLRVDDSQIQPFFLAKLINESNYVFNQIKMLSKGSIMEGLNSSIIKSILIIVPQPEEQIVIANFLSQKTALIDQLIDNKHKLVELLKEERTAIINQAVTKGINPNTKLKPSGVEWLGDIPEQWDVKKLKYVVSKVGSGITPLGGASVYQQEGVPLLRSQNIYPEGLVLDEIAYISEETDEQMSNSRICDGDILLNITGASIGRCFYVPEGFGRGNVNQHVCIIRPVLSAIKTKYLHYFIVSDYGQTLIDYCQNGANREGLNFQQIKAFDIPLPNLEEQEKVITYIQIRTQKIYSAVSKIEKEIELLREYRRALVSEVVTGRVKVV